MKKHKSNRVEFNAVVCADEQIAARFELIVGFEQVDVVLVVAGRFVDQIDGTSAQQQCLRRSKPIGTGKQLHNGESAKLRNRVAQLATRVDQQQVGAK